MAGRVKYRDIVRDIALDNYGFVTTKMAADAGVPPIELPKLTARGGLQNVAYGLYRVPDIPSTELDQYADALFRVGQGAYLCGESTLALLDLADLNPRTINVATPRRVRATLPRFMTVTRQSAPVSTTIYEGLASQRVADAIVECRGSIDKDLLCRVLAQARREGLVTKTEYGQVRKALSA